MLTLSPEMTEQVYQFQIAENLPTAQEALRHLLSIALASTPKDGVFDARVDRAYHEVRKWTLDMVTKSLGEIKEMLDESLRSERRLSGS